MTTIVAVFLAVCAWAQGNHVTIDDFEIYPDSTITVPVYLVNTDETRGLQFKMTLPKGLSADEIEMTDYSIDSYMTLNSSYHTKDSSYMVIMYPSVPVCFPPDSLAVLTIVFKASADFKGGNISIWRVRGSTLGGMTIQMENSSTTVTVPEASLIGIPIDTPADDSYFNLMGQLISTPIGEPVAIHVCTSPMGKRIVRKVSIR